MADTVDNNPQVVDNLPGEVRPFGGHGLCHFSMANTLQSPCFWILVGALGTLAALYMMHKRKA